MIIQIKRHQCGTWNLWNLSPHNIEHLSNYLYLLCNRELCGFHRFHIYWDGCMFLKCLGKGSTGSTPAQLGGFTSERATRASDKGDRRLPIKVSVVPLVNPRSLQGVFASGVPMLEISWKNLVASCSIPIRPTVYGLANGAHSRFCVSFRLAYFLYDALAQFCSASFVSISNTFWRKIFDFLFCRNAIVPSWTFFTTQIAIFVACKNEYRQQHRNNNFFHIFLLYHL